MITDSIVWLEANPEWAGFVIFLVAFLESLAVIGLLVPGAIFLFTAGALVGSGHVDFFYIAAWGVVGAILGDGISYFVGYHYHHLLDQSPFFKKHQKALKNSEIFFKKYGLMSVALGRFIGPIRAFIPLAAGIFKMRPVTFYVANVLSALVWAPAYLMPGIIAGAAIDTPFQNPWITATLVVLFIAVMAFSGHLFLRWQDFRHHKRWVFFLLSFSLLLIFLAYQYAITQELYILLYNIKQIIISS